MRDKAELTDKAEELEHTVLQLQGETETIGILYTAWNSLSLIFALWRPETDSPSLEIAHSPIFYSPGLKGPQGASSVWIVCLSVCPSVIPSRLHSECNI